MQEEKTDAMNIQTQHAATQNDDLTELAGGQPYLYVGATVKGQPELEAWNLDRLASTLRKGSDGLAERVERLRRLVNVDPEAAKNAKADLPFFIGATFSPAVRRAQNLVRIDYLVLDLDQVVQHGPGRPGELRRELASDPRVLMAFVSPSGTGLKVVFQLREPCFDANAWRAFYQGFARDFADRHQLGAMVDEKCHDATRVCFLSHDPETVFKPQAESIDWRAHLPSEEDLLGFSFAPKSQGAPSRQGKQQNGARTANGHREQKTGQKAGAADPAAQKGPSDEQMEAIRRRLKPNALPKKDKQFYLPPEVVMVEQIVTDRAEEQGLALKEVRPMNYGKKFVFGLGAKWCEVNLFYSKKKGYATHVTPKSGSDPELGEVCRMLLENVAAEACS